jgi:hypothetical protein
MFLRFVIQVEGNLAGAGDALMLDCDGFVSETNATNIVSVNVYSVTLKCFQFYIFVFLMFGGYQPDNGCFHIDVILEGSLLMMNSVKQL